MEKKNIPRGGGYFLFFSVSGLFVTEGWTQRAKRRRDGAGHRGVGIFWRQVGRTGARDAGRATGWRARFFIDSSIVRFCWNQTAKHDEENSVWNEWDREKAGWRGLDDKAASSC